VVDGVIVTKFNFLKVVWQHCAGEMGKSVIVVLQIVSVYCVLNLTEIGQSLQKLQKSKNVDIFIGTQCITYEHVHSSEDRHGKTKIHLDKRKTAKHTDYIHKYTKKQPSLVQ